MQRNNFDFVRLALATFVLFSHAFILGGYGSCDWLCRLTGGQATFSALGVKGFFSISGFLVFQSLLRSRSLLHYFWKRCLRIFPGLAVALLITVLTGPLFYDAGVAAYLHNRAVYTYLPRNLLLVKVQFGIPGIFARNPAPHVPNGSLWTIPFEVTMYVLLAMLFFIRGREKMLRLMLVIISFFLLVYGTFHLSAQAGIRPSASVVQLLELGSYFFTGAALAAGNLGRIKRLGIITAAVVALMVLAVFIHCFEPATYVLLPLLVISFGLQATPLISRLGKVIGDISYGVYIYAYLVQQALVYWFHPQPGALIIGTVLVTYPLAWMSWQVVEKRALRWKKLFGGSAHARHHKGCVRDCSVVRQAHYDNLFLPPGTKKIGTLRLRSEQAQPDGLRGM